jgi:hypothetical protein
MVELANAILQTIEEYTVWWSRQDNNNVSDITGNNEKEDSFPSDWIEEGNDDDNNGDQDIAHDSNTSSLCQ